MELANRDLLKVREYEPIAEGSRSPCCSKRIVACAVVLTLLIVVIVTFVCTWGSSEKVPDAWEKLPTLEWEGDCPVEAPECPQSFQGLPPPLLLVSLDGFRPDYLSRSDRAPTIRKLARCGVRARYLNPVYPSKTFPNHYTQVTGLYPSSHGIIDNAIYDPDTDKDFKLGQPASFDPQWWQREPIWVSAEKQGKRTATFFWPGSDVRINGTRPTFYRNYSSKVPYEYRVVQILEWLDLPPPLRPSFLTLYFDQPDRAAHEFGTGSKEVQSAVERVDRMVEGLFAGLQARNLTGCVNVFIASDHGMVDIDCKRVVDLREYINVSDVRAAVGTFGRLRPIDNRTSESDLLMSLRCRNPHLRVFLKEDLPVRMHYWENPRIEPVMVDTDRGWTIFKFDYAHGHKYCTGAAHGYDNFFPDMRALFMAIGPSMKRNVTVEPFLNIELYELMCELIGITPNPNNGTRGSLHHLLKVPPLPPRESNITTPPTAEVAKDVKEYAKRVDEAQCPCAQSHPQVDIPEERSLYHLPLGAPSSSTASVLLLNNDYVLGYDVKKRTALWAAFTINVTSLQDASNVSDVVCWRGDARVAGVSCKDFDPLREQGFIQWPLYPPIFSSSSSAREEASYVTNSVPVSVEYATLLDEELWRWLKNKTTSLLNVVTGPAFLTPQPRDDDRLLVPSHRFVIATSCSEDVPFAECRVSQLRVDAFLLPNYPYPDNCEAPRRVIERNAARVVDIEGVTGLKFFTFDAPRLRTALPSFLTRDA